MELGATVQENRNSLVSIVISMRPKQWVKNLFVIAPLVFSKSLFDISASLSTLVAFSAFCALSSAVYLLNDTIDREKDRKHPVKQFRPIASGVLMPGVAVGASGVLAAISFLTVYWWCGAQVLTLLAVYLLMNLGYSLLLKQFLLVDVFIIAVGFVIRVIVGGLVINVELSSWLLICTLLIALFLALCKRRHELALLDVNASEHRAILGQYNSYLLDQLITIVAAATAVSYALYTMSQDVRMNFGDNDLEYTLPFVLYGLFRYLYIVHRTDTDEDPTAVMMSDRPMLINLALWALMTGILLYV